MVVLCLLLASLVACGGRPAADSVRAEVRRVLDHRAAALLARDAAGYAATGTRDGFAETAAVPLAGWSYRVGKVRRTGDEARADVELSYRLAGHDRGAVTTARTVRLGRERGRWSVVSDRPADGTGRQLWDQGTVRVVRAERGLVLGVGQSEAALRGFADLVDRAVPAVSDAWDGDWARRLVVLVPESLEGMAGLLGSPASSYRGIAAVTTGETGAPAGAPADRIVVNPEAYRLLGTVGRQVVLTHEATHVATRAHTSAATPLWLSEGYADWVGYRGGGSDPARTAPELSRAVSQGHLPESLPADEDFGFTGEAGDLARAYEGGWTACRMIAEQWGEARLDDFYRAVGAQGDRDGADRNGADPADPAEAVGNALGEVLGTTPEEFTARWREYLRARFG
ncbi:hypothetical protein GCM10023220_52620 [Streptomyces ziwulingensis]|uniref:Lipoprotein n=1 Tax=Streptomyces ziwulingensis TaxID=1045501 RepID=A0ABP9CMC7_9ACTN